MNVVARRGITASQRFPSYNVCGGEEDVLRVLRIMLHATWVESGYLVGTIVLFAGGKVWLHFPWPGVSKE